jgi:ATP-dependent DNA helicase RecG
LFRATIIDLDLISIRKGKKILSVTVGDRTGRIQCKWFNFNERYMRTFLKPGSEVFVSGNVTVYNGKLEIYHPDIELVGENAIEDKIHYGRIVPIYSETEGLGKKIIRRIMFNLVETYSSSIQDFVPQEISQNLRLPPLNESFREVHFPSKNVNVNDLKEFKTDWQRRLVFDEFFILELHLHSEEKGLKKRDGISFTVNDEKLKLVDSKIL